MEAKVATVQSGKMTADRNCWVMVEPVESWTPLVVRGHGKAVARPVLKKATENAGRVNRKRESML
jgi:hypothetical protein